MTVLAENNEVDEVEQEEVEQEQEVTGETPEAEQEQDEEPEPEEVVVSIGDASPASEEEEQRQAPEWVKELRKENREKSRQLRELQAKLAERDAQTAEPAAAIPKPTLEGCEYDTDLYEQKFQAWQEQEAARKDAERKKADDEKAQVDAWNAKVSAYNEAKTKLKVSDYDDAEAVVQHELSITQQGIIVSGADNPALVTYALGKNPAKAKELASIKDPVKFAFAVAKLETQVKTSPRKAPPAPEGRVRTGNAAPSGAVDNTLERLREKAEKTGDMSEVIAYKTKQRAAK